MLRTISRHLLPGHRSFITVIHQAESAYRELLGQGRKRLEPGLRWDLPILHQIKRVSLKEDSIPINNMHAFSKDNVPVKVSCSIFYRVTDSEKVCYSITNHRQAVATVGESSARAVIGKFDYDEIISDRNAINKSMLEILEKTTHTWGMDVTRLEIQDFGPQNHEVAKQLERQMEAERARRQNELDTQSSIRTAEGLKQSEILKSEGRLVAAKNEAEATRYTIGATLAATTEQVKEMMDRLGCTSGDAIKLYLESERLKHLQSLAKSPNAKLYFVDPKGIFPMDLSGKI